MLVPNFAPPRQEASDGCHDGPGYAARSSRQVNLILTALDD
jgi:hypothetical protein